MLAPALRSLAALRANDDNRLAAELRLVRIRAQVAVVRALMDHIERLARAEDADGLGDQLREEMARLGSQLSEAAAAMTGTTVVADSGVFLRADGVKKGG